MKGFLQGAVLVVTTGITAVVIFPLVPLWTFAMWYAGEDELLDAAADAFESYLEIIRIE